MAIKHGLLLPPILCTLLTASSLCAGDLIDPTRPINTKIKTTSTKAVSAVHRSWTLESTLVAHDRRVAVINGKLVSEGDTVDGARVIKISKLDVVVKTSGKRMTLQLLPDIVKKIP